MVIGHDVAILADDDARAEGYAGLARLATGISAEEEFKGIEHLTLLRLLGLLYLDVHDGLDRGLSRGDEVGGRAHGAGREGGILEAVVRSIATRIGSAVCQNG